MREVVIIVASIKEISQLINHSGIKFTKLNSKELVSDNIKIIITGVGKKNVYTSLSNIQIANNTLIIKAGTAAIIDEEVPLMTPFIPKKICHETESINISTESIYKSNIYNKNLITIDEPLTSADRATQLYQDGFAAVDMESFFVAMHYKNVIPLIVGTDRGTEISKNDFFNNLSQAAIILSKTIKEIIRSL